MILRAYFLGSTHFPNEKGAPKNKGVAIEKQGENITILRREWKENKIDKIRYIFAGPSYLNIGKLTVNSIIKKAVDILTKEIKIIINGRLEGTKLLAPKLATGEDLLIEIAGCSRSGAIAQVVYNKLRGTFDRYRNVRFKALYKSEEYSGPFNRIFLRRNKESSYKDVYKSNKEENIQKLIVLSFDIKYISNILFKSIAFDKTANVVIFTLKNHRDCGNTPLKFKKADRNAEERGVFFEVGDGKKFIRLTKSNLNTYLQCICEYMMMGEKDYNTEDNKQLVKMICKKLSGRRADIFRWAIDMIKN